MSRIENAWPVRSCRHSSCSFARRSQRGKRWWSASKMAGHWKALTSWYEDSRTTLSSKASRTSVSSSTLISQCRPWNSGWTIALLLPFWRLGRLKSQTCHCFLWSARKCPSKHWSSSTRKCARKRTTIHRSWKKSQESSGVDIGTATEANARRHLPNRTSVLTSSKPFRNWEDSSSFWTSVAASLINSMKTHRKTSKRLKSSMKMEH